MVRETNVCCSFPEVVASIYFWRASGSGGHDWGFLPRVLPLRTNMELTHQKMLMCGSMLASGNVRCLHYSPYVVGVAVKKNYDCNETVFFTIYPHYGNLYSPLSRWNMALGFAIIVRSPYTPYSIYFRGSYKLSS